MKDDSQAYAPKNAMIPIEKVKLFKSFLFINDTLSFSGAYYLIEGAGINEKEEVLYGNLLVGDTLITDNNPEKYVVRRRDGVDTKFYTWPHNLVD